MVLVSKLLECRLDGSLGQVIVHMGGESDHDAEEVLDGICEEHRTDVCEGTR